MPFQHLLGHGLLTLKAEGRVVLSDFHETWENLALHSGAQLPIYGLIDFRDAHIDLSDESIASVVSRLNACCPFKKLAVLAARGSFAYVVGYLFCEHARKSELVCDLFISEWKARAWLLDQSRSQRP